MFREYCTAILQSFYSPRVYRDAISRWPGFGGAYLALVSVVLAALLLATFIMTMNRFERTELPHLLSQVPAIMIDHGIISVEAQQPIVIYPRNKGMLATIDTTKSESELRDSGTTIGIGKDFIFIQKNGEYQVSYLERFKDKKVLVNRDNLQRLWDQMAPTVKTIAGPLIWMGQVLDILFKAFAVAVLSYVITAFMPEEFVFVTRMRLAALALTPPSIISLILLLALDHETAPWFVFLLSALYIYVMLILIRQLPAEERIDIVA